MRADLTNITSEAETPMHGRVITRITALVAILTLALALPAFAQTSPTADTYVGKQGDVLGNFDGGGQDDVVPPPAGPGTEVVPNPPGDEPTPTERGTTPTPTPSVSKGELPFTGLEAGLVALAGLALLGSGFAMRRASRPTA
jgi:hypothetical protein